MQVRALLYTSTLTNAIMEAMANVETAVMAVLAHQTTLYPRPPPAAFDDYHLQIARASAPVHEALALSGFSPGKQWLQQNQTGTGSFCSTIQMLMKLMLGDQGKDVDQSMPVEQHNT